MEMYSGEIRGSVMRGIETHLHTDDPTELAQRLDAVRSAIDGAEALIMDGTTRGERLDPAFALVHQIADIVPYGVPQTLMTGIYDSDDGGTRSAMSSRLGIVMFGDFLRAVELAHEVEPDKLTAAFLQGQLSEDDVADRLAQLESSRKPLQKALRFNRQEDEHNAWSDRMRQPARQIGLRQRIKDIVRPATDPFDAYRPGF